MKSEVPGTGGQHCGDGSAFGEMLKGRELLLRGRFDAIFDQSIAMVNQQILTLKLSDV